MPKASFRARRVADAIQRILAELIRREIKDPRIGAVTITAVEVSSDLSHAKIYLSSWEGEAHAREAVAGLTHAASFLRQHLARELTTYRVPQLHFLVDTSIERGMALTQLIDQVAKARSDKEGSDGQSASE